jgi:hypothetical protein
MLQCKDTNFKLVVMNELLEIGSFVEQLHELQGKPEYTKHWTGEVGYDEPIPEIENFLRTYELTENDLKQVTELCFDGGNNIYHIIRPFWDGEDDYFEVVDVGGFEALTNLKTVNYISMITEEQIDRFRCAGISIE